MFQSLVEEVRFVAEAFNKSVEKRRRQSLSIAHIGYGKGHGGNPEDSGFHPSRGGVQAHATKRANRAVGAAMKLNKTQPADRQINLNRERNQTHREIVRSGRDSVHAAQGRDKLADKVYR